MSPLLPISITASFAIAGGLMQSKAAPARDPWDVIVAVITDESMQLNEVITLGALRAAVSSQATVAATGNGGFVDPACAAQKGMPADPTLSPGARRGYRTSFHAGPRSAAGGCGVTSFAYVAAPEMRGKTGLRTFCIDDTGDVRASAADALPVVKGGRCPASWKLADAVPFAARPLSDADRRNALEALDRDPRSARVPDDLKERVRALLGGTAAPTVPKAGRAHAKGINALAFTPDGRSLVSAGMENPEIKVWSLPEARLSKSFTPVCGGVTRMVMASDAATIAATCTDSTVKLFSLATGKMTASLGDYGTILVGLSPTRDRRSLLTTAKGKATVVALPTGTRGATLDVGGFGVSAALSPDGTTVAAGGMKEDPLRLWTLQGGQLRGTLDRVVENMVEDIVFSPDGRFLAVGFGDGGVGVWETSTQRAVWRQKQHGYGVNAVAFSPDGQWLVSASSDKTLKVWSMPAGEMRTTLRGHAAEVNALALSPDGRTAASGGSDGVLMLWDLGNGSARVVTDPAVR